MSTQTTGAETIRWDLQELFSGLDDPKISLVLTDSRVAAEDFVEQFKGKLGDLSPAGLAEAYEKLESISGPLYRLSQYINLLYAVDTTDDKTKALLAKIEQHSSVTSNLLVFFSLELGNLSDEQFSRFEGSSELSSFAYKIVKLRKNARYNLSEKEEQIINLKDLNGASAHQKLYNELVSSFSFDFEIDGETQTLNGDQLRALRQHPDADVRQRAMQLFFSRYEENALVINHLYNALVKDHGIEVDLRGFKSPISVMNTHNDLSDEAIQALNEVTTESYTLVNRYYKLKAKILGLDTMTLADIYAPLPEASKFYSFEEAQKLVLDGFRSFDNDFYKMAKSMFDENRIDAPVEPKKRGGAFCSSSTPDLKPYVLLNYTGKVRDVSTMAHEIGHAIHAMFSSDQKLMNYHSILPLAETASIFSEMVLTDSLLKKETDVEVKKSMLTGKLEDIFASSHRQNMFSSFEIASHAAINEQLQSAQELSKLYTNELKKMFGDSVAFTPEYAWEWSSIPHIFNVPFYVYAYNFGNLLVLALYQQYLDEGDSFKPKYKEFLSMGSSASPADITGIVGADINHPDFWRKSLKYIESLIDQLEELVG
ncbi:MAG: M3 family oligoendopeptidase [Candidatus Marinimicrobia bacterium]|nr:M3 family oligoendopeptidase [Candidatus Neomarinimicrobiota bacterium]